METMYRTVILPDGTWQAEIGVAGAPTELQQALVARGYQWSAPAAWLIKTFATEETMPEYDNGASGLDLEIAWLSKAAQAPSRWPTIER